MRATLSSSHNASSLSPTHNVATISHLFLAMKTKKFIQLSYLDCKLPHTSKFCTKNIKNKRKHTHMSSFLPLFLITTFISFHITHSSYNHSYHFSLMYKNCHHCSSHTRKETSPLLFHQKKNIAIVTCFQFSSTTPNCNNLFFSKSHTKVAIIVVIPLSHTPPQKKKKKST